MVANIRTVPLIRNILPKLHAVRRLDYQANHSVISHNGRLTGIPIAEGQLHQCSQKSPA
jgi:hypothetical protein